MRRSGRYRRVVWGYYLRVIFRQPYPRTVDREAFRDRYGV